MGKYEPLSEFLRKQSSDKVRMSFARIERIIGAKLPPKAQQHRAWWSNNPSNNVMTKAWLAAGFKSADVDIERRTLVFQKVGRAATSPKDDAATSRAAVSSRHPLIGAMKGTVWTAPGTDLTQPAMPEWGEVAYGNKTWDDFK
jgi:hypothetical protein